MNLIPFLQKEVELNISKEAFVKLLSDKMHEEISKKNTSDSGEESVKFDTVIKENHFWLKKSATTINSPNFMKTIVSGEISETVSGIKLNYKCIPNIISSLFAIVATLISVFYFVIMLTDPIALKYWLCMFVPYALMIFMFNENANKDLKFMETLAKDTP